MKRRATASGLALALLLGATGAGATPPAFPGAAGFGADASGGRGGRVLAVTNLDDSGPGSLRAALGASGPRTVVFRVAGTIRLEDDLDITNGDLSVAGQTAPGGGITLRGGRLRIKGAQNVILRHLRVRLGPERGSDAFAVGRGASRIVVDHCSFSWGSDETASIATGAHDVTFSWNIVSEALDRPEARGKGSLISSGSRRLSFHHNLWAHCGERNPKLSGVDAEEEFVYDMVNNVIYNWRNGATFVAASAHANVVKNFWKRGPDTRIFTLKREIFVRQANPDLQLYVEGNLGPSCPRGCGSDEWDIVFPGSESRFRVLERHPAPPLEEQDALSARDAVLAPAGAGASLGLGCDGTPFARRDPVDARVVEDVRTGGGSSIDDPASVGGWPELEPGTACEDGDGDGLPDAYERAAGLDPADPGDGARPAGSGYTHLEEFLNRVDLVAPRHSSCPLGIRSKSARGHEPYPPARP